MKKLSLLILLSPVFFFLSCDDDDVEIRQAPIVFYDNDGYLLQATCVDDYIEFFFDITPDTTDARMLTFPNGDFYTLYVDYNNNGTLDRNIDLLFGPLEDGRICRSELLTETSTTPCMFSGEITGETLFSATENSSVPHINYLLRVPKEVLSNGSTIGVIVEVYDSASGRRTLPIGADRFGRTLTISW